MKFKKAVAMGMVALSLAGCAEQGAYNYGQPAPTNAGINKQQAGTLLGAVGGAIIGSNVGKGKGNVAAIAAGTLLGAALGNSIGASLDRMDMMYYNQTTQHAMETAKSGTALSWNNPDSGNYGTITPMNVSQNQYGQYCREYSQTITVGGRTEKGYGTACRQPDGSWQIVQ